jgi:hypothetical protein
LGYDPELNLLSVEAKGLAENLSEESLGRAATIETSPRVEAELNRFLQNSIGAALERVPPQRLAALKAAAAKTIGFF